jgi:hypothetical protein
MPNSLTLPSPPVFHLQMLLQRRWKKLTKFINDVKHKSSTERMGRQKKSDRFRRERERDRSMQNQNRNPLRNVVTLRSFAAVFGENMWSKECRSVTSIDICLKLSYVTIFMAKPSKTGSSRVVAHPQN